MQCKVVAVICVNMKEAWLPANLGLHTVVSHLEGESNAQISHPGERLFSDTEKQMTGCVSGG